MPYNTIPGDNDSTTGTLYDHWWLEDGEDIALAVFATVQQIDRNQEWQRVSDIHNVRMYSNRMATGISGQDFSLADNGERIKLNIIKSCIDAAAAQIATNRPRAMFLTEGGDYSEKRKARNLNKYCDGQFYACDQYEKSLKAFIDAGIVGNGHVHVYSEEGRIKTERVFPTEIIVDEVEARHAPPRQMFRHKEVDRAVLLEQFGTTEKLREAIKNASLIRDDSPSRTSKADLCSVLQAWHLPSGENAKDGMSAICISNAVLQKRPWKRQKFPVMTFRITDAPLGFRGIGFSEELTPMQVEINYLAQKIQELMDLATTQVWTKKGDGVGKVDNRNMGTRTYKNTPPVAIPIRPAAMEYYQHLWALYDRAFEIVGVSQLAAQSKKPSGLNSGEAIRTYNDISSRRFQHVGQRWERFHMHIAEAMIDEAREIVERGDSDNLKVLTAGDSDVESIDFKDVSIDDDKYVTKVWPVALLPASPQGKIATITELSQVSPQLAQHAPMLLTSIPDLESVTSRINAPYELVDMMIENMLDRGIYEPPAPYMDLNLAQQQTQLALMRAHKDQVSEDRLELLRRFLSQTMTMLQQAQAAAMPPPAPEGPPGPGGPAGPMELPAGGPASIPGGPAAALPPGALP